MSPRHLDIHPAASDEVEAASRWYRQRSLDAAERSVLEVNEAIFKALDAPERWPAYLRGTRHVKTRSFSFLVIYHVNRKASVARRRSGLISLVSSPNSESHSKASDDPPDSCPDALD